MPFDDGSTVGRFDGEVLGEISHETWGARLATVTFHGRSAHPGMAKGVMINAAYALADCVAAFPRAQKGRNGRDRPKWRKPVRPSPRPALQCEAVGRCEPLLKNIGRLTFHAGKEPEAASAVKTRATAAGLSTL